MISVIIPLYNNEKFIKPCLQSVINQSYKDIEIVIVNDGSTDNSLNIVEEIADRDNRIKIINQKNSGRSAARNIGIKNSSGDFLMFVDADDELEKMICEQKLWQPISELQELCQQNAEGTIVLQFPAGQMKTIASMFSTPIPMQFALHISQHLLKSIIELVKNCIFEWTIRLESEGILGEGMRFSQEETVMAQKVPQTINNYYGTVVNGDVQKSQIVSGDNNTVTFSYEQVSELINEVKKVVKDSEMTEEDRETADELITDVETKIENKKKSAIIKAALNGLKDFLVGTGANVAGALIMQYLQQGF